MKNRFMVLEIIAAILLVLAIAFFILYRKYSSENAYLKECVSELASKKQSLSTRYGRMTEQFMPFLESYPFDEHNFRFLGTPIDGIQFEDDKIVLMEFKSADSKLTQRQKRIKELVEQGKVEFHEFRIK